MRIVRGENNLEKNLENLRVIEKSKRKITRKVGGNFRKINKKLKEI